VIRAPSKSGIEVSTTDDYVQRVRASAMALIRSRYLLAEDLDCIVERAKKHWAFAIHEEDLRSVDRR
jgi:hypothetical protein